MKSRLANISCVLTLFLYICRFAADKHRPTVAIFYFPQSGKKSIKRSSPELAEGSKGRVKSTIFGAPCDVMPPFTQKELRQNYLGCQNLPTALWLRKLMDSRKTSPLDVKFAALLKQMKHMG